jgi:hypothetical protein
VLAKVLRRLWGTATVTVGVAAVIFVLLDLSGNPVALLVAADAPPQVAPDNAPGNYRRDARDPRL